MLHSAMVALAKTSARMTVAEFLEWDSGDRTGRRWQLVDGEPQAMAPASENHGVILIELGRLIGNHLIARGLPCRVIGEPGIVPRAAADINCRISDLAMTCSPPGGATIVREPVLLIEILSPSNQAKTRAKVVSYRTIPSVTEIVVVDSTMIAGEIFWRGADSGWPDAPERVADGDALELRSTALREIYRTTSLDV